MNLDLNQLAQETADQCNDQRCLSTDRKFIILRALETVRENLKRECQFLSNGGIELDRQLTTLRAREERLKELIEDAIPHMEQRDGGDAALAWCKDARQALAEKDNSELEWLRVDNDKLQQELTTLRAKEDGLRRACMQVVSVWDNQPKEDWPLEIQQLDNEL